MARAAASPPERGFDLPAERPPGVSRQCWRAFQRAGGGRVEAMKRRHAEIERQRRDRIARASWMRRDAARIARELPAAFPAFMHPKQYLDLRQGITA